MQFHRFDHCAILVMVGKCNNCEYIFSAKTETTTVE
jgi:hypothetical protein